MAIGVFDSGVGGLSVLKALQQLLPKESYLYFGDTARVPYGDKSLETIQRYTLEGTRFLIEQGVKALVIACNTASIAALDLVVDSSPIPVIGMVHASVEAALRYPEMQKLAILGTRSTIEAGVYADVLSRKMPGLCCLSLACPLFAPLVEEGKLNDPLTQTTVAESLRSLREADVDALLLACTHFSLLKEAIGRAIGQGVRLIDPKEQCAEALRALLTQRGMLEEKSLPSLTFYASGDRRKFTTLWRQIIEQSCPPTMQTTKSQTA